MIERYEAYKDSGVEWIGAIPQKWRVSTIGRIGQLGRGRVISNIEINENPGNYPVYSSQTKDGGVMGYMGSYDFEGEYVLWTTDGANAGTVTRRAGQFNCTNVCGTLQPNNWDEIDLRFLPYFLNLGTRFSVRLDINPKLMNGMMAKVPVVLPPKGEQTTIANFLDRKTAEMDALIAQKERLLELYEEEKTAIINHAVTRGIDSNAELKDSGIDWLGEIPVGWEVVKLSYGFQQIGSGTTPTAGDQKYYFNGKSPWVVTGDLNDSEVTKPSRFITCEAIDTFSSLKLFPVNTLLIAMYGATIGKVGVLKFPAYTNQACCALAEPSLFNERYTFYWFLTFRDLIISNSYGGGQPNISQELIRSLRLHCPPINEQTAIANFLDRKTEEIDAKIAKTQRIIELQKEYRTALISEVVTGKIKVPKLPTQEASA